MSLLGIFHMPTKGQGAVLAYCRPKMKPSQSEAHDLGLVHEPGGSPWGGGGIKGLWLG
jgi:hypothetical protein